MKIKFKKFLSAMLVIVMLCGLFAVMPITAGAANANSLKTTIESFAHGGDGELTAKVSGNTVTVTGTVTGVTEQMTLNIDPGVTVVWKAMYSGSQKFNLLSLIGSGTFEVAAGGSLTNTGNVEKTLFAITNNLTVNISGGSVGGAGFTLYIQGDNCSVNISGGIISSTNQTPVYVTGKDCKIKISDGTVRSLSDNYAIYVHSASTNTTLNITGGLVFSYDKYDEGIIAMDNGKSPVIGGTAVVCAWIKPTSGSLVYNEGSISDLNVIPAGAASWGLSSSIPGINYKNGSNEGFIRILEATVTASEGLPGPFRVTEHPIGANYKLNEAAVPLRAVFSYDARAGLGYLHSDSPIKVQWYWSYNNTNTERTNKLGESSVSYNRIINHTTTQIPATDTVGVKYYYAVLTYYESGVAGTLNDIAAPRETATNPARIEVVDSGQDFRVRKVDGDGKALAGAVIALPPLDAIDAADLSKRTYEATTASSGYASFTAANGYYLLSEKQAPSGYNATDVKYYLVINSNGIYMSDSEIIMPNIVTNRVTPLKLYETVTFVNKKIPDLEKDKHFAFMQGYPEGDFRPNKNMTRAEAVVMFSRLLAESMNLTVNYKANYYPDVPLTAWYANQVCYMHLLGVLSDYSRDGKFRPDDPVTRAEFATLASHFDNLTLTAVNVFTDVPNNHWAVKYINSAAAKGWITGYPDHTFKPEANITRAEVVTLVGRMIDRFADSDYLTINAGSLPKVYTDLPFKTSHWAYLAIMEASTGHEYIKDSFGEHWTLVY